MALRMSAVDASYKRIKDAVTSQRTPYNFHANATDDHAFAHRPLCAPTELLLHCRRPYCTTMVTLRRPRCALIRALSDGVCFEHAHSARRRLAFYAITQRLLATSLRCCGDARDRTVRTSTFCIFLGRRGIAVRSP